MNYEEEYPYCGDSCIMHWSCLTQRPVRKIYGENFKSHPYWQKACQMAQEPAHLHQDTLDQMHEQGQISGKQHIEQSTGFVPPFFHGQTSTRK